MRLVLRHLPVIMADDGSTDCEDHGAPTPVIDAYVKSYEQYLKSHLAAGP